LERVALPLQALQVQVLMGQEPLQEPKVQSQRQQGSLDATGLRVSQA
jgi:hypothetical protein